MTKTDKLRAALRDHNNRMTRAEAVKILGAPGTLSNLLRTGEISTEDVDGTTWVVLDPNYTRARQSAAALPIKRRAAKKDRHKKSKRTPRNARPFKAILEKTLVRNSKPSALDRAAIDALIVDNALIAGETLAQVVRDQVENLNDNPALLNATKQQERAAELARAAHVDCPL